MLSCETQRQNMNSHLKAVVLNITNKCNLKCSHCFNGSSIAEYRPNELTDEEIIEVIKDCIDLKVENVCFSGGEPLIRRALLLRCLKLLQSSNIRTSIVSNGTLIDYETANLLRVLGVAEIEISLDGAKPVTHEKLRGVKGSYNKALASMKYLVNTGVTTSVSFTLNSWNGIEFYDMVQVVSKIGVYGVYVRPLIKMGTAVKNSSYLLPNKMQYRKIARDIYNLKQQYEDIEMYVSDPLNHIIDSRENLWNPYVEIQSDGSLQSTYCIKFSYGNLRRHRLREYWEADLAKVWQLPDIKKLAESIYCYDDLAEVFEKVPSIDEGSLSHCDIIDDANIVWEQCVL